MGFVLIWLFFMALCTRVAVLRGDRWYLGTALGFLTGPLGLLVLIFMPRDSRQ